VIHGEVTVKRYAVIRLRPSFVLVALVAVTSSIAMASPAAAATNYDATADVNSMFNTTAYSGVKAWWEAGFTGEGIDVAVIDTGVTPVEGLATPDKIIYGPDLTLESQASNLHNLDTNGHGTFMAGIIAGRGSLANPASYASDPTNFLGVAPDARIVSLKVGTAGGSADVSQVIAAIDWVVQHRDDHGLNIRVLNLSYGTDSTQPYTVDPLAFAVEQAWKAGIFVVAATGNEGYVFKTGTLTDPAYDPKIFAVGATDSMGSMTMSDDTVAPFSSTGSNARSVDVVAPGSHIVSLRVPGSAIDQAYGSTGYVSDTLFRGSGTSEAAAFTSGEAALAIQQRPSISPNQLKKLFLSSGRSLDSFSSVEQGQGEVDMSSMLVAPTPVAPNKWSTISWSTGTGSLELSRGSQHLVDHGLSLVGEMDIFGHVFDAPAMAAAEAARISWSGGVWNGNTWSGNTWSGNTWSGNTWSGNTWSGNTWSGNTWSGNTWSGNTWSGNTWSGNTWSGSTWSSQGWKGATWKGATWH
jgi:serine protease AprX